MRAWELMEDLDSELQQFANQTKRDLGLQEFRLYMSRGDIKLDTIIVGKDSRKEGVGSDAMTRLTQFADQSGKRIILSPAVKDDHHGTTSRSRLIKFYKQFGFKENKGRMKDFAISDSMMRDPKGNVTEAQSSAFRIFCDMDGVLVDFKAGATEFMADPKYGEEHVVRGYNKGQGWEGKSSRPFWKKLKHVSNIAPDEAQQVWANLDWMSDGKKLWSYIGKHNPVILSSPGTMSRDIIVGGKEQWLKNHLGISSDRYIFEVDKWKHATGKPSMQHILIDDKADKVNPWVEHGGIGILHTSAGNTIQELKKWGL